MKLRHEPSTMPWIGKSSWGICTAESKLESAAVTVFIERAAAVERADRQDQGSTMQTQGGQRRKQEPALEINVRKAEAMLLQSQTDRERCDMNMHETNRISQQHSLRKSIMCYGLTSMRSENSLHTGPHLKADARALLWSWICLWGHWSGGDTSSSPTGLSDVGLFFQIRDVA